MRLTPLNSAAGSERTVSEVFSNIGTHGSSEEDKGRDRDNSENEKMATKEEEKDTEVIVH